jgi:hypothetical protein
MCRRTCHFGQFKRPWCAVAAIVIAGLSIACFGQADAPLRESETPPRLLLLFDGRVIIGDISEVAGGYAVRRAEGTITLPFEFVRLTATSLPEAYEKQRDNLENPNAEQHLTLARWCFRYHLREQAVAELEAALKLEPFRREARELLKLIEAAESDQKPGAVQGTGSDPAMTVPGEQTSAGISQDNHVEFVRRIQPLLVNKCGNATCHGSVSTNGLRLHNVRTGRRHQRIHSDENLATILEFVDSDFPLRSPLLRQPQDPDSPAHRGVFAGALGADQVRLLHEWVHAVAVDRQLAHQDDVPVTPDPQPVIERTGRSEEPASSPTGPRIIEIPRNSDAPASPRRSELLRNILDEERPDAFDPQEFNRRVHGVDG